MACLNSVHDMYIWRKFSTQICPHHISAVYCENIFESDTLNRNPSHVHMKVFNEYVSCACI
jgi:hypothetical protein